LLHSVPEPADLEIGVDLFVFEADDGLLLLVEGEVVAVPVFRAFGHAVYHQIALHQSIDLLLQDLQSLRKGALVLL
jgi:hypothetical protein